MKAVPLILCLAGAAIGLLQPFVAFGNARWGAGYGDLMNGGLGLGLMVLGGAMALLVLRRQRQQGAAK